jgi:hypothetical protein
MGQIKKAKTATRANAQRAGWGRAFIGFFSMKRQPQNKNKKEALEGKTTSDKRK